jgi:molybdopterin converting factor small subunit
MVKVVLTGSLKAAAGGRDAIEVEARDIRGLFAALERDYPAFKLQIERGLAVSIDGQIYRDSWFVKIPEKSEVCLIPRIAGG